MKLPWDKKYIQIAFHVVVTIIVVYCLGLLISHMNLVQQTIMHGISFVLSLLAPLIVAGVFAFLANSGAEFFQSLWETHVAKRVITRDGYRTRKAGTIGVYLTVLLIFGGLIWFVVYRIGTTNVDAMALKITEYVEGFTDFFVLFQAKLAEYGILKNVEGMLSTWAEQITTVFKTGIMNFANSITRAGGWIINLVIGLTIAFYLLMEKDRIMAVGSEATEVFFPSKTAKRIKMIFREVVRVFSGYLGGQVVDATIMAVLFSASLSLIGIPYAVLIGILSGFSNLIPYVGAIMGFLLSVVMGLLSGTPIKALYAMIVVLVLQQIDSIFIVPRVVGKSVEMHPALVLLSLAVFGGLFGLLGMLVAVPCGALLKTLFIAIYERKKAKKLQEIRKQERQANT